MPLLKENRIQRDRECLCQKKIEYKEIENAFAVMSSGKYVFF